MFPETTERIESADSKSPQAYADQLKSNSDDDRDMPNQPNLADASSLISGDDSKDSKPHTAHPDTFQSRINEDPFKLYRRFVCTQVRIRIDKTIHVPTRDIAATTENGLSSSSRRDQAGAKM